MSKKVAFYTLGCKLNYAETSTMGHKFQEEGFEIVHFADAADIYVINTCSVTENADKKCKKVVKEALYNSPNARIVIVGCYAQLKPEAIAQIPGVDMILGAAEKFQLIEHVKKLGKDQDVILLRNKSQELTSFHSAYSLGQRTRSFLKVQDGCNYSCSFCTIPQARGPSRSGTIEDIRAQAKAIAAADVKEIVLTGVNIGDFGLYNDKRNNQFIDLLKELDDLDGIARIRISSIEPNLLSNEIIEFVAQSQRIMPHFHVPLQSGSNKVLALMRRRYQRQLYQDRVKKIKSLMPDACIGVDVIVGFPGELESDFLDTYYFLEALDVSYLHVFTYSERPNTPAATMKPSVPVPQRALRSSKLHSLSNEKRSYFYQSQLGKVYPVLFESVQKDGYMHGFTSNYVKVKTLYDPLLVNELQNIQLTNQVLCPQ